MTSPLIAAEIQVDSLDPRTIDGVPVGQPPGTVLVAALCRHKCDGIVRLPGQQYYLDRARAEAGAAREIVYVVEHARTFDWWTAPGRVLSPFADVERVYATEPSAGSLKIAQGVGYDPGSAAFRHHSAINAASQHTSAFIRFYDSNPHCSLRQYDAITDASHLRDAVLSADVLHCHVNYMLWVNAGLSPQRDRQLVIRHYHGSRPDGLSWREPEIDADCADVIVGARLAHVAETVDDGRKAEWCPIPVDVRRYRALVPTERAPGPFRIAHAPTKRSYKGTEAFIDAIDALCGQGLAVEAVLIENKSLADALTIKATCDAVFDSFWLGLQGSGLEGGAMGLPVIAGDEDCAALYREHVGYVPYTFANTEAQLREVIGLLATDEMYRSAEANRVADYVAQFHDYPAVAARYEDILARALGREDVKTPQPKPTLVPKAPPPTTQQPKPPKRQRPKPVTPR